MRFVNGRIHMQDRRGRIAGALACAGGRIIALGEPSDLPAAGDEIDLHGRTVLPGLIDAHAHLRCLAEARLSLDLSGAVSVDEVIGRVADRAAAQAPGSWISGQGWDETAWPDGASPHRAVLDRAAPRQPAALTRVDAHALWLNSAALTAAGIDDITPDPAGGRIVRDAAGRATGLLIDAAMALANAHIPPADGADLRRAVAAAMQECLRFGLTGVHEMGVDSATIALYRDLIDAGRFPLRLRAAISDLGATWQEWRERGSEIRYGDRLSIAALKLYADGALGSRGAALLEPYSDDPGNVGLEVTSRDELERLARDAVEHGFQVCIHAIGDRANRNALDAYERVLTDHAGEDLRLRIEHAQMLAAQDVPRFQRLGVIPSMQPVHCMSDMPWVESRLGAARSALAYAWRSLLDTGVIIAGGSDFPVEPPNPMRGIAAAITRGRSGAAGATWHPEQCLTRAEAVSAFTSWAAYAGFDEAVAGSLKQGKYADFIVLDRDIFTCPPAELAEIKVLMTVVAGEIVFSEPSAW